MRRRLEYCCDCGEPTGRAGRGDDSIYVEVDGQEIGPLCEECLADYEQQQELPDDDRTGG